MIPGYHMLCQYIYAFSLTHPYYHSDQRSGCWAHKIKAILDEENHSAHKIPLAEATLRRLQVPSGSRCYIWSTLTNRTRYDSDKCSNVVAKTKAPWYRRKYGYIGSTFSCRQTRHVWPQVWRVELMHWKRKPNYVSTGGHSSTLSCISTLEESMTP